MTRWFKWRPSSASRELPDPQIDSGYLPKSAGDAFSAPSYPHPSRRLRRVTWAPNNSFLSTALPGAGLFGTAALAVGCPDDFYAIRLGFANVSTAPFVIGLTKVRSSDSWNDYANPTGDSPWVTVTAANRGLDVDRIAKTSGSPTSLLVRGTSPDASTGFAGLPAWSWTDWVPVRSGKPDSRTKMRVLMIRHLIDRGQTITFANGAFDGLNGLDTITRGFGTWIGGYNNGTDHVTVPDDLDRAAAEVNRLTNGSIVSAVQFATINTGVVGMTTGDSHHIGVGTTTSFHNYLFQATSKLGAEYIGQVPMGIANCAQGGAQSARFFACLDALLPAVQPNFVVLPGWSYNDWEIGEFRGGYEEEHVFLARLIKAADRCSLQGAVPIFLTPFPRDRASMSPARINLWLRLRNSILTMKKAGALVVDATAILGHRDASDFDGTYLPDLTSDGIHPNDEGHAAIAEALIPLIRGVCELS